MRLFFAVDFTDDVKDALQRAIDGVGIADPPWRWVARDNFHITLKFLGEMPEDRVEALAKCVAGACRGVASFDIRLGGFGGFPNLKKPRVLFYKVDEGVEPLLDLAKRVDTLIDFGNSPAASGSSLVPAKGLLNPARPPLRGRR